MLAPTTLTLARARRLDGRRVRILIAWGNDPHWVEGTYVAPTEAPKSRYWSHRLREADGHVAVYDHDYAIEVLA